MTSPTPPGIGLRALGAALLDLVCARAELIAVELREERARAEQKLVLVLLAVLFLAMSAMLAALLVVVLFWEAHRLLAAGGVTALFLGVGVWALARLRELGHDQAPPFAATLGEFASDLRLLRGRDA